MKEKWKRIFASKRYHTKDGVIILTPLEQQELIDDMEKEKERIEQMNFQTLEDSQTE